MQNHHRSRPNITITNHWYNRTTLIVGLFQNLNRIPYPALSYDLNAQVYTTYEPLSTHVYLSISIIFPNNLMLITLHRITTSFYCNNKILLEYQSSHNILSPTQFILHTTQWYNLYTKIRQHSNNSTVSNHIIKPQYTHWTTTSTICPHTILPNS